MEEASNSMCSVRVDESNYAQAIYSIAEAINKKPERLETTTTWPCFFTRQFCGTV
tara:strand:+ start:348 stop:512 length:165 start_codon:yes stop_codon:yes gene_type:complete